MGAYNGSNWVQSVKPAPNKVHFDWKGFGLWVLSLLLSMMPVYIAVLKHCMAGEAFTLEFIIECYGEHDVLWAFGTVLLFCCFNIFSKKQNTNKWAKPCAFCGLFVFLFIEITWYIFKYHSSENASAVGLTALVIIGSIFLVASILIATLLQIYCLKVEGNS